MPVSAAPPRRSLSSIAPLLVCPPAQGKWHEGKVYGLDDPLNDAPVLNHTLAQWRGACGKAEGTVTGPATIVGAGTFASPAMVSALHRRAQQERSLVRLGRADVGNASLSDPFNRLPRDELGRKLFDLWAIPRNVTVDLGQADVGADLSATIGDDGSRPPPCLHEAPLVDVSVPTKLLTLPADPEVTGGSTLNLTFSPAVCGPVEHWAEVLRINLLMAGGRLYEDSPLVGVARLSWAVVRALSFQRDRFGAHMNRIGRRCRIHPSAVVEFSALGDDVTIGPGAIVRASVLGNSSTVSAQTICELSVVGDGSTLQRKAMVVASTVLEGARLSAISQFSLCGRHASIKLHSVTTDMNLGGKVKTPVPGGLGEIDIGYLGSCFGHRSFVGSGVWFGPGRLVPNDVRIARPTDMMVLKPTTDRGRIPD